MSKLFLPLLAVAALLVGCASASAQGRFAWAIDVQPVKEGWAQFKSDAGWQLDHVRVSVTWDSNRRVQLDTFKLGHTR